MALARGLKHLRDIAGAMQYPHYTDAASDRLVKDDVAPHWEASNLWRKLIAVAS